MQGCYGENLKQQLLLWKQTNSFAQNIHKSSGWTESLRLIQKKWLQLGKRNTMKGGQSAGVLSTRVYDMKETGYSSAYSGVHIKIQLGQKGKERKKISPNNLFCGSLVS